MEVQRRCKEDAHELETSCICFLQSKSGGLAVGAYHTYRRSETVWKSGVWAYGFIKAKHPSHFVRSVSPIAHTPVSYGVAVEFHHTVSHAKQIPYLCIAGAYHSPHTFAPQVHQNVRGVLDPHRVTNQHPLG